MQLFVPRCWNQRLMSNVSVALLTLHSQEWSMSNFPCSPTSYSMKDLAFHSLGRWKVIIPPILTTSPYTFSLNWWDNVLSPARYIVLLPLRARPIAFRLPHGQRNETGFGAFRTRSIHAPVTREAGKKGDSCVSALKAHSNWNRPLRKAGPFEITHWIHDSQRKGRGRLTKHPFRCDNALVSRDWNHQKPSWDFALEQARYSLFLFVQAFCH